MLTAIDIKKKKLLDIYFLLYNIIHQSSSIHNFCMLNISKNIVNHAFILNKVMQLLLLLNIKNSGSI